MKKRVISAFLAVFMLFGSINTALTDVCGAEDPLPAFVGAEGGGMYSLGSRAADNIYVYHVTNLNDSGAGSFRNAVSEGNRIVVFDIAGTIMLESNITCKASNITILGQTAPGEGICVAGASMMFNGADNVIVRYMRFRSGDYAGSQEDGLGIRRCTNVIIDHCSVSWSVDECLSAYENKDLTVQNCIISESLNESIHGKGKHGYGGIWGGINASFHHNLISTHNSRNPRIGTSATVHSYNDTPDYESLVDIRNNFFYNWGMNSGYGGENNIRVNFVNNYYKPSSKSKVTRIYQHYFGNDNTGTTLYVSGNVMEGNTAVTKNNWLGVEEHNDGISWTKCESISDGYTDENGKLWRNDQYLKDYPVTTQTAQQVYDTLLDNVGANIVMDEIDRRVIDNVKNGTLPTGSKSGEGFIDTPDDVEGYIMLYGSKTEADTDNDGMPDSYEETHGLDKNNPNDNKAIASNGYTNLENYGEYVISKGVISLDKGKLRAAVKSAEGLNRAHYGDTKFDRLDELVEKGKLILGTNDTQDKIDACADEILAEISTFKEDPGYKLSEYIEEVENAEKYYYTMDSYIAFEDALNDGKALLGIEYTEEEINAAVEKIKAAKETLEYSTRLDLFNAIRQAEGMPNIGFYPENWRNLQNEIAVSQKLYDEFYVSEADYTKQTEKLNSVFNSLDGTFEADVLAQADFDGNGMGEFVYGTEKSKTAPCYNYINGNNTYAVLSRGSNIYADLSDTVNTVGSDSIYMFSADVCNDGLAYFGDLYMCLYDPEAEDHYKGKIYGDNSITVSSDDNFIITYPNNQEAKISVKYDSGIKAQLHKWYNICMIYNAKERTGSVYIDGQPAIENFKVISGQNCNEFYPYVGFRKLQADKHHSYPTYLDNLKFAEIKYKDFYTVFGDADADGVLTATDASVVLQKVLKENYAMPLESNIHNYMDIVDVDCDGCLTASDAALIMQKVLAENIAMPIEVTTQIITEITTETTTQTAVSTESTTEATTEHTIETTTSLFDYFDFSGIPNGVHTDDYTSPVFAVIANKNGYTVGEDSEKYIILNVNNDEDLTEGYIEIYADSSFALSVEADFDGYGYSRACLADENGNIADITEYYGRDTILLYARSGGKYRLYINGGTNLKIYKIGIVYDK